MVTALEKSGMTPTQAMMGEGATALPEADSLYSETLPEMIGVGAPE